MRSGSKFGDFVGLSDSGTSVHARWRSGVFLPAVVAAWAIFALISGEIQGGRSGRSIVGPGARAIGLVVLSGAFFWHVQQFWEPSKALARYAFPAKAGACLVFAAALFWLGSTLSV
jgi:hypothetical protein